MNNLVTIINQDGKPEAVCLTPETARFMDGWLAAQLPKLQPSDQASVERLRAELKPVFTPELAYAEWGMG